MCTTQETLLHSACFQSSLGSQNVPELKRFAVGSISLLHLDPEFPRAGIFFFLFCLLHTTKGLTYEVHKAGGSGAFSLLPQAKLH